MVHPRLSAIDVDGTLVGPDKTISPVNSEGIREYITAGGTVVLASGRMYSSILPFGLLLDLPENEIILAYNGAMAKTIGGELLFEKPVPADLGALIVEYCQTNNLHLNFYHNDELYVAQLNAWSDLYLKRSGSVSIAVGDLHTLADKPPTKLLIIDEKSVLNPLVSFFQQKFGDRLYITKTDDEYLEFMAGGVDKGSGLRWVSEHVGVAQSDTAAFGDSFNDIPMIAWAGIGVAMSNGRPATASSADLAPDNTAWDAVGTTLKSFVGNRI